VLHRIPDGFTVVTGRDHVGRFLMVAKGAGRSRLRVRARRRRLDVVVDAPICLGAGK